MELADHLLRQNNQSTLNMSGCNTGKVSKVDFCTIHNATDISSWSGTNYFIWQMLKSQNLDVNLISDLGSQHTLELKLQYRLSQWLGQNFYYGHSTAYTKYYANQLRHRLTS